ncbi:MAG: ROK family transcriptional regulator [Planctomycetes bacterium]|nr:ROK family transcriptional regulator [Planctomycetota bacterium]
MNRLSYSHFRVDRTPTQISLLQAIRNYESSSRTRLSDMTGIQHAAISRAVSGLLEDKLVYEKPMADSVGPRRKSGLYLNPDHGYVIGMEYMPCGFEAMAVNFGYMAAKTFRKSMDLANMPQARRVEEIISYLRHCLKECSELKGKCLGVSLLDPGMVDTANGRTVFCSVMDDWRDVPIAELVGKALNLPVLLPHCMSAKVAAVDRFEIKGNRQNVLFIEYGDGIACGLKLAGAFPTGHANCAGEMGHIHITDREVLCRCGAVGCLEAVCALPALAAEAHEAIKKKCETSLAKLPMVCGINVLEAAAQGDRLACRIVEEALEHLAKAVCGLVNILDPELIVFDNRMKAAGPMLLADFVRNVSKRFAVLQKQTIEIRFSDIETHLGSLGAGVSLLDRYLASSSTD